MPIAIICGTTGQDGAYLCKLLLSKGCGVIVQSVLLEMQRQLERQT